MPHALIHINLFTRQSFAIGGVKKMSYGIVKQFDVFMSYRRRSLSQYQSCQQYQ